MSDPIDTNTMRSLIEAANSITNPTTLVRHTWLTEEEVEEAIAEATKGVGNRPMTGVPAGAKTWSGKTTKLNKFGNYAVVAADENGSALSWANRTQAQNFSDRHNLNGVVEPSAMGRSFYVSVSDISEATRVAATPRAVTNRQDITEASKSQIEALEKAVEQATKNKNKAYAVYFEALKAVDELASAAEAADKVTQDAIKALAAAKAENSRVVYFSRSRFG